MNEKLRTFEDWWDECAEFTTLGIGIKAVAKEAWYAALESIKRNEVVMIELPLPHPHCSPNCQKHWRIKSKAKKLDRLKAFALAKKQGIKAGDRFAGYRLEFVPKDRRRHDIDNYIASEKAQLDGISDACCQDDSEWKLRGAEILAPNKESPCVRIIFDA